MTAQSAPPSQEMSLAELFDELRVFTQIVWDERWKITRITAVAGLIGLFLAFASGEEYTARTRVLPYRSGGAALGGLSNLAGIAGIRLPSGAADQTITADLYPEIAKSQDFKIEVAETPIRFAFVGRRASTVQYFREIYNRPLTELLATYTLGLPGELLASLRSPKPVVAAPPENDSAPRLAAYDLKYMRLVRRLDKRLSVFIDKRTSIITITAEMPDPYAAADLVRVTSDLLMARIIDYETRKAGEQYRFIGEQLAQAKTRYEVAQGELAAFNDRNRALISATSQIERSRLQRDYDLTFEVYQQLSRELEQARIKMKQDTPAFTVLEKVAVPYERTSPRRGQQLLISVLLGALIGVGRVGVRQLMRGGAA